MSGKNNGNGDMSYMLKSLSQAFLLVLISCLAAAAVHAVRPSELPWRGNWSPAVVAGIYLKGLSEITAEKVHSLEEEGLLVFLDPREPAYYNADSPPGSLNVPPREVPSLLPEIRVLADAGMELVILCDGGRCTRGAELARILQRNGFHSFRIFRRDRPGSLREGVEIPGGEKES